MSEITRDILTFLASMAEVMSPYQRYSVKREAMRNALQSVHSLARIGRALATLKYRGYVQIDEAGSITLTPKGRQRAQAFRLDRLVLEKEQPWDGRWRIIIWDVPEVRRKLRDQVRATLKKLGFVRLQRSVWATPYPCLDQIAYLRDELALSQGLVYIEADFIEDQGRLRRHFNLNEPQQN